MGRKEDTAVGLLVGVERATVALGSKGVGLIKPEEVGVKGGDEVPVGVMNRVEVLEGSPPVAVGKRAVVGVGASVG